MNILHIAPYFPSVHAMHAGGVAMGHEIETLQELGHKVYKISFVQSKYDRKLYLLEKEASDIGVILTKRKKLRNIFLHPFLPVEFATRIDRDFLYAIRDCIINNKIDCIHAEYTPMLWYSRVVPGKKCLQFNGILHDVSSQNYCRKISAEKNLLKKLFYLVELRKIQRFETKYFARCDSLSSFSEKDRILVEKHCNTKTFRINTFFNLEKIHGNSYSYQRREDGFFSICFMGQMGRKENNDAALRLIRIFNSLNIRNKILYIIGANPSNALLEKITDDIVVTGFVDDIDKYILENCDVACFPLLTGAGIKIKVLQCLALGLPVVTNQIGAEGIDERGKYINLAETDDDFIKSLSRKDIFNKYDMNDFYNEFSWNVTRNVFKGIYGVVNVDK